MLEKKVVHCDINDLEEKLNEYPEHEVLTCNLHTEKYTNEYGNVTYYHGVVVILGRHQ